MRISNKNVQQAVYRATKAKIEKKFGQTAMNSNQLTAVAKRALEEIKKSSNHNEIISNLIAQNLHGGKPFRQVVSEVIVSGKSPWKPELNELTVRQQMLFNVLRGNSPSFIKLAQD